MGSLFGGGSTDAAPQQQSTPPASSIRIQSSIEGRPRAICWGSNRLAPNIIWYGDFYSQSTATSSGGQQAGGKGGLFDAPAAVSGTSSTTTNYFASVEMALCEGPVAAVGPKAWVGKEVTTLAAKGLGALGGDAAQMPWSYLQATHPEQALTYRNTCYLFGNLALGQNPELPHYSVEVTAQISNAAPGVVDANFAAVLADALANQLYGVPGWQGAYNANWQSASDYWTAAGLFVSIILTDTVSASQFAAEALEALNVDAVWSEGVLKLVPLGDESITGNGVTWNPPAAPTYDFDDDDYLYDPGSDPVQVQLAPPRESNNLVKVEYLDRASDYNPAQSTARDDGAIRLYGERGSKGVRQWHMFKLQSAADMAAQLALGREKADATYTWRCRPRFMGLDPGDIVTLTEAALGLSRQWVRIQEVKENQDRSLTITAREYLKGTGASPVYGEQANTGDKPNYNADPGGMNDPLILEPTAEMIGAPALEIWAAASGQNPAMYGGCDVWASYDNENYRFITRARGAARMGALTAPLAAVPANAAGQTIDEFGVLSVDLSESGGSLSSGTLADALGLNTACWIDEGLGAGELVAYRDATLTAPNAYDLQYLVRGGLGTEAQIVLHPTGTRFARLDESVLRVPYTQDRIGSVIYLKFVPFNLWGGGGLSIADVEPYAYRITGAALASPLPVVQNVRAVYKDGFSHLWFDEVQDFRTGIRYLIKKGDTYSGAQTIADVAHPDIPLFGPGTYWVTAYAQPVPGLLVYSEDPTTFVIAGNMLVSNLITFVDFQTLGWPGTFDGVGKEGADPTAVLRLTGQSDILSEPDVLSMPDVLNAGGIVPSGTWTAGESTWVNVGYVADCYVNASWVGTGAPVGQNILAEPDVLAMPDVLGAASTQFVNVWLEISTAVDPNADVYVVPDVYDLPDVYTGLIEWSDYQRFVPGVYRAQFLKFRAVLESVDSKTIAFMLSASAQVSVKPRIDHYQGLDVGVGGVTIIFVPDTQNAAAQFNGGPLLGGVANAPLPYVQISWSGTNNVHWVQDDLTLDHLTGHFEDGAGTHVAVPDVNFVVEGY